MKLLLCKECSDIFSLSYELKQCTCGATKGQYTDNLNACWSGKGIPLCISNPSLTEALAIQRYNNRHEPDEFYGARFEAWVCPANSKTFKEIL